MMLGIINEFGLSERLTDIATDGASEEVKMVREKVIPAVPELADSYVTCFLHLNNTVGQLNELSIRSQAAICVDQRIPRSVRSFGEVRLGRQGHPQARP
jgi:hypothetical protein